MINLTVLLKNVPHHFLTDLRVDLEDVQESYYMVTDATIIHPTKSVVIDIESFSKTLTTTLNNVVDILEDTGLSPYVQEIGVEK